MFKSILSNQQLQALVNNLTTRVPKASFSVGGKAYLASKVAALAQSVLTSRSAASGAKGKWIDARAATAQVENEAMTILNAVRAMLVPMLLNDTGAMTDLAVSLRKAAPPLSAEERVVATAKGNATRKARGTASKKSKAKVKGNVTGVVMTPITSQVTPQAPPLVTQPIASPVTSSATAPAAATSSTAVVANDVVAAPASPVVVPAGAASIAATAGTVLGH